MLLSASFVNSDLKWTINAKIYNCIQILKIRLNIFDLLKNQLYLIFNLLDNNYKVREWYSTHLVHFLILQ